MGKNLKIVFFVSRNGHFWPFFSPKWHFFAHFVHTKNTGGTPPFWGGVWGGVMKRIFHRFAVRERMASNRKAARNVA